MAIPDHKDTRTKSIFDIVGNYFTNLQNSNAADRQRALDMSNASDRNMEMAQRMQAALRQAAPATPLPAGAINRIAAGATSPLETMLKRPLSSEAQARIRGMIGSGAHIGMDFVLYDDPSGHETRLIHKRKDGTYDLILAVDTFSGSIIKKGPPHMTYQELQRMCQRLFSAIGKENFETLASISMKYLGLDGKFNNHTAENKQRMFDKMVAMLLAEGAAPNLFDPSCTVFPTKDADDAANAAAKIFRTHGKQMLPLSGEGSTPEFGDIEREDEFDPFAKLTLQHSLRQRLEECDVAFTTMRASLSRLRDILSAGEDVTVSFAIHDGKKARITGSSDLRDISSQRLREGIAAASSIMMGVAINLEMAVVKDQADIIDGSGLYVLADWVVELIANHEAENLEPGFQDKFVLDDIAREKT